MIDLIKCHSNINVKELSNDDEEMLKLPSKINNNELNRKLITSIVVYLFIYLKLKIGI